jgi:hypothetical protein
MGMIPKRGKFKYMYKDKRMVIVTAGTNEIIYILEVQQKSA